MAASTDSILQGEISVLQSIYLPEELEVHGPDERPFEVAAMLSPYTAGNELKKHAFMQLIIKIDKNYPNSKPLFSVRTPRGISENQLDSILVNLDALASRNIGEQMLFTLIEYAKEFLTNYNRPVCPCAICLDLFEDDDSFTRTQCFHFFHDVCIARYVKSFTENMEGRDRQSQLEEQEEVQLDLIPCPVCRTILDKKSLRIDGIDTRECTSERQISFEPSEKFLTWRRQMSAMFQRQQQRGGIIDVEAERNKFLIETKTADKQKTDAKIDEVTDLEKDLEDSNSSNFVVGNWIEGVSVFSSLGPITIAQNSTKEREVSSYKIDRTLPRRESNTTGRARHRISNSRRVEAGGCMMPLKAEKGRDGIGAVDACQGNDRRKASQKHHVKDAFLVEKSNPKKTETISKKPFQRTEASERRPRELVKPPPGFQPLT